MQHTYHGNEVLDFDDLEGVDELFFKEFSSECLDLSSLPSNVERIHLIDSKIDKLILSEHAQECYANNIGLKELIVGNHLRYIYCEYNQLTTLDLPTTLWRLYAKNNRLTHLTQRGPLHEIMFIDVRNNQLTTFDLQLGRNIEGVYIAGNSPDIKIKHLDWAFTEHHYICRIPPGDYVDVLTGDHRVKHREVFKARVYELVESGQQYIDLKPLYLKIVEEDEIENRMFAERRKLRESAMKDHEVS